MLSDLSPGDKLSLKGKIFELQKKLQIIDIRNRQKEEFSYKPTLYNYDLPNRDNNVLDSINKAEIIRKQKKDMLQAAVLMQSEEGCTFAPVITNKSKRMPKQDTRPVHLRLTEKGKMYNDSIEQLRSKMCRYDDNGRKLFTPAINKDSAGSGKFHNMSTDNISAHAVADLGQDSPSTSALDTSDRNDAADLDISGLSERQASAVVPTAAADEFLYQDARDREERFRMREREVQAGIEARAAATKMNSSSVTLLRRKAERDAKLAFRAIVQAPADKDDVDEIFGIDDIQKTAHSVYTVSKWADEALNTHISTVFSLLDNKQDGRVGRAQFLLAAAPLLLHSSVGGAMQEYAGKAADGAEEYTTVSRASAEELSHLHSFLRKLVSHVQNANNSTGATDSFKPHIYQHSFKLAQRKERKERERIEEVLAVSKAKAVLAHHNNQQAKPDVEDGDDFPPPPPADAVAMGGDTGDHQLNESSDTLNLTSNTLNHHDIMYARAMLKQQNLQRIAEEVSAKQMKECTFRPKLIPPMPLHVKPSGGERLDRSQQGGGDAGEGLRLLDLQLTREGDGDGADGVSLLSEPPLEQDGLPTAPSPHQEQVLSKSVHDRLYNLKDKKRSSKSTEPSKRMVEELQACTFAPQMGASFFHKGDISSAAPVPPTEKSTQGALKSVERMRRAREMKQQKAWEESHEHQAELLNQSYARSREIARQGVVPFKFVLADRLEPSAEKVLSPSKRSDPDLIVDVKLSAIKTAKISIWRGDDPYTLASSFARIYSLDGKARDLLVTVIRNSMEQNGLIVTPDPLMDTPHAAPDGFQHSGAFDYTGEGGAGQAGRQSGDDVYEGLEMLSAEDEYYSESSVSGSVIEGDDGQSTISDEDSVGSATEQSEPESENLTA